MSDTDKPQELTPPVPAQAKADALEREAAQLGAPETAAQPASDPTAVPPTDKMAKARAARAAKRAQAKSLEGQPVEQRPQSAAASAADARARAAAKEAETRAQLEALKAPARVLTGVLDSLGSSFIGPEGGLTPEESETLQAAFVPVLHKYMATPSPELVLAGALVGIYLPKVQHSQERKAKEAAAARARFATQAPQQAPQQPTQGA